MHGLMQPVLEAVGRINARCGALGAPIFSREVTVGAPKGEHPELDFLRSVSWLYVFWFECAVNSTRILAEASETFGIAGNDVWYRHKRAVEAIRTLNQHGIRADSNRGQQLIADAEDWFAMAISTPVPSQQEHYTAACQRLVAEAVAGISMFESGLSAIEESVLRDAWLAKLSGGEARAIDNGRLDAAIEGSAAQIGFLGLSIRSFRERHQARWRELLGKTAPDAVDDVLTRAIQRDLLEHANQILPLRADEIILAMGLSPGPEVGRWLRRAQELRRSKPRSRDELLGALLAEAAGNIAEAST
jgi:hypothetical protein